MDLFEEIVNEVFLINESVSINSINDAISGLHPVWITYDDGKGGNGKNRRLIYPVAYGLTSIGNPVIRAFQPQGSTKRGVPKWKYFRVDRIKFWRVVNSETFNGESLDGFLEDFNDSGDKSMSVWYTIAPIGNAKNLPKQQPNIGYKPITKQDVENIPTEEEPTEQPNTTPVEQPRRYNGRQIINNILNKIKNSKVGKTIQNIFNKSPKNIDNSNNNNNLTVNNNNNLTAPDTEPITKSDIQQTKTTIPTKQIKPTTDEPVSKEDVKTKPEEETVENNNLTNSFNDLMSRWNNLKK